MKVIYKNKKNILILFWLPLLEPMYRNVAIILKLWLNFGYSKSQKSNLILGLLIFNFGFRLCMASILIY